MKVLPYDSIRVEAKECLSLKLDVSQTMTSCKLVDRSGNETALVVGADNAVTLPQLSAPALYDIVWFSGSAESPVEESRNGIESVRSHYFSIAELRAYGDGTDSFSLKSDESVWEARARATEEIENAANRCWVPRIGSTSVFGGETSTALDHCDVSSITTDGWKLDCDCRASRSNGDAAEAGAIEYVYGKDSVPAPIKAAALSLAAYYLRAEAVPDRAVGEATDAGFLRFTIAGKDGPTGLPEVDAAIAQFGRRRFG